MEEITNDMFLEYIEKIKKENTLDNLDQDEKYIVKITSVNKGVMFLEVTDVCIIPKVEMYNKPILEIAVSKKNVMCEKEIFKDTYPFINVKESIDIDSVEYYHDHGISFFDNIDHTVEDTLDNDLYCYLSDVILESAKDKNKLDSSVTDEDVIKSRMISGFLDDNIWKKTYEEKRKDVFTKMSMSTFIPIFNTCGVLSNESNLK